MSALILPFDGFAPKIDPTAFVAPNATLIGEVEIGADAGIWYTVVLRGDGPGISIGAGSNIQDGSVIHVASRGQGTVVGKGVSVGHMALLHACTLQDHSFVGMHATVLDGAIVETGAMVAAGALVPPRKIVRAGELWAGNPARKMRDLSDGDRAMIARTASHYIELARAHAGLNQGG